MGKSRCAECGWTNDANAMMCARCGAPLPLALASSEAPTLPNISPPEDVGATRPVGLAAPPPGSRPASVPPPPLATAMRKPMPGRRRRGARRLRSLLVTLALPLVVLAGIWGLILRPALHAMADQELRRQLVNVVAIVPQLPPGKYAFTARNVAEGLAEKNWTRVPVRDIQVRFAGGRETVMYQTWIVPGSISTELAAVDGRLVARNTQVQGLLGWVESGDELQQTLNDALAGLPPGMRVVAVSARSDTLTVTVGGK